ncbi:Methyltransferase domain-containing protein [Microbispora rosea]|uniref:Methyltransferase domain-containing protein n=1 Tax=Microbispora rosea TaxID=58117 RepID=A0A1N6SQU8_9ACTN|nr:class I SAM-dependent methyltransferase [Microbispora rosea]GIH45342.1 type 11 methyltransferase [Microbispora rosea subsp. rosea]SIQ43488.1 Methyltransferase domain-containing protein [Microbispora rosea]
MIDPRANYGVDAPGVLAGLIVGGIAELALAAVLFGIGWPIPGAVLLVGGIMLVVGGALFAHTTLRGKFAVWDAELDRLGLKGDEQVLDLGCGRGLVLLKAAARLSSGRATGIDLWSTRDQSGNSQDATWANARAEGVAGRVDLVTGDMRDLPFDDAAFDLVVSSLAIHNIPQEEGRAEAVREAFRVLRRGGLLRIADFRNPRRYAEVLTECGAADVEVYDLGWRFWYGGPHARTSMVACRRP